MKGEWIACIDRERPGSAAWRLPGHRITYSVQPSPYAAVWSWRSHERERIALATTSR